MKKNKRKLLLGAVCLVALSGCGNAASAVEGSAEIYAQAAQEMLEEADSFAAEFEAVVSMNGMEKTTTNGQISFVKDPLYMKVDTKHVFGNTEQEYVTYLEKGEDGVAQYMSYDGQWTEMTMTEDNALASVQIYHSLYNMELIFTMVNDWTVEQHGDKIVLQGVIPESKVYAAEEYTRWFQLAGMSGLSEVYFANVGDVPVTIALDAKTGEPLSYEADLAQALETVTNNVLTELGGGTLENGVTVTEYTIQSELTQLGDVEAAPIPDAAKSSAINYEKEIFLLEGAE